VAIVGFVALFQNDDGGRFPISREVYKLSSNKIQYLILFSFLPTDFSFHSFSSACTEKKCRQLEKRMFKSVKGQRRTITFICCGDCIKAGRAQTILINTLQLFSAEQIAAELSQSKNEIRKSIAVSNNCIIHFEFSLRTLELKLNNILILFAALIGYHRRSFLRGFGCQVGRTYRNHFI